LTSRVSGAFKCTGTGAQTIFMLPVGLGIIGAVLGFSAIRLRSLRAWARVLAPVQPILGLVGSCQIAAQDAATPPDRSAIERAQREMTGRPRFAAQEAQYLAMLTEVKAAITERVPAMAWTDPVLHHSDHSRRRHLPRRRTDPCLTPVALPPSP
jgi:hypothetical protein